MINLFKKFNIKPNYPELYDIAFMHGSYGSLHNIDYTYERLEFLGDSVLNLIVSEYLYKKFPEYGEGELSKLRANYVCQIALIHYSHELELDKYIKLSSEEETITNHEILSITADIFESFLGAIFLDQGMQFARNYISKIIFKYIDEGKIFFHDYKSKIKEYGDAKEVSVKYEIVEETGPAHDKTFRIRILVNDEEYGVGKGKNKKDAEQIAAKKAIHKLNID